MCVEAGNVLQGTEQLVLLLLAHVESGTTVKAAADHHAGDRGLDGCAAVPTEAPLTVPVLPRGSFRSPVLNHRVPVFVLNTCSLGFAQLG